MLRNDHSSSKSVVYIWYIADKKHNKGLNENSIIDRSVSKQTMLTNRAQSCFRNDEIDPLKKHNSNKECRLRVLDSLS